MEKLNSDKKEQNIFIPTQKENLSDGYFYKKRLGVSFHKMFTKDGVFYYTKLKFE